MFSPSSASTRIRDALKISSYELVGGAASMRRYTRMNCSTRFDKVARDPWIGVMAVC